MVLRSPKYSSLSFNTFLSSTISVLSLHSPVPTPLAHFLILLIDLMIYPSIVTLLIIYLPFPLVVLLLYKTSGLGNNINSYKSCELNPYHGLKTVLDAGHTLILCTLATNPWCATVKGKLHSFIHSFTLQRKR